MKHIQGAFILGYVTISITGKTPELFFQTCINEGIQVWNVNKVSKTVCEGNIKLSDLDKIKQIKHHTKYKLTVLEAKGLPLLFKIMMNKKEFLAAIVISCLFVVLLSNIIWEVKVTGVSKEVEEKITDQLEKYGIYAGKLTFSIDTPSTIQNKLINDIPELLWIGVHKKGTTFQLEGVEKTMVEQRENSGPRHLIANKSGVITSMYVAKGLPIVKVHDFVEAGDLLVSGIIDLTEEGDKDKDKDIEEEIVAAEGEVWANTWYKVAVTIPLTTNYELVTGDNHRQYGLKLGKFRIPIWGFGKSDYEHMHVEINETPFYLFKWKMPIKFVQTILNEKVYNEGERSKDEAIQIGIAQAKKELELQLGPSIQIINEKILHETIENGKVNLNLHFTVEENIVKVESITQGD